MLQKSSFKQFFRIILPKLRISIFIAAAALTGFLVLRYVNSYFQIKTIHVEGEVPTDQIRGLENLKGTNLYFLTDGYISDILVKNNPDIQINQIIKELPNKIILKLKYIQPIAKLKLNVGFAQLSVEGKILKKSKPRSAGSKQNVAGLPIINFYQQFDYYQISTGNNLGYEEIVTALFLLEKSQELDLKIETIDISGLTMIVFNLKDKKIIFTSEKPSKKQAFELEAIIKQFKIEAKEFKVLDLRFDKPIVKF